MSPSLLEPQAAPSFSQTFPTGLNAPGSVPDPGEAQKKALPRKWGHPQRFPKTHPTWLKRRRVGGKMVEAQTEGPECRPGSPVFLRGGLFGASQLNFFFLEPQPPVQEERDPASSSHREASLPRRTSPPVAHTDFLNSHPFSNVCTAEWQ